MYILRYKFNRKDFQNSSVLYENYHNICCLLYLIYKHIILYQYIDCSVIENNVIIYNVSVIKSFKHKIQKTITGTKYYLRSLIKIKIVQMYVHYIYILIEQNKKNCFKRFRILELFRHLYYLELKALNLKYNRMKAQCNIKPKVTCIRCSYVIQKYL